MRLEGKLRRQALAIFKAALRAANPGQAVAARLAREDFTGYRHIYIVGAG